jgi:uncharacterized protein YutE (UPF0331/DUF86 family)
MRSGDWPGSGWSSVSVVLRPEAIRARLLRLELVVSRLQELSGLDRRELQEDFRAAWTVERGLQLAAEIVFDIGNHILSAHFAVTAQDYEDILTQLAAHRVLDPALRERLRGLGGFRNILVHGYLALDTERVADALSRAPQDFSGFIGGVRAWLSTITS